MPLKCHLIHLESKELCFCYVTLSDIKTDLCNSCISHIFSRNAEKALPKVCVGSLLLNLLLMIVLVNEYHMEILSIFDSVISKNLV